MEKPLTLTAISGWALPSQWFHEEIKCFFPDATINVLYPLHPGNPLEAKHLLESAQADLYIGYSLGSLWLMTYKNMLPEGSVKAVLAPILAFTSERNRGGKTEETKLKYLTRQLKRNPKDPSPLLDFYSDSEIKIPDSWLNAVPENEVLLEGLEFLLTVPVPDIEGLNIVSLVGQEDRILDADKLKHHLPQLEIIPDAGHAPGPLLKRLADILNSMSNE
jgi:pimeloyl-ACP methyl ester carboxylesterase